jgi:hypothetical protein
MDKKRFQISTAILLVLVFAFGVVSAVTTCPGATSSDKLKCALREVCLLTGGILPVMAFVLFVLAGVSYAVGNFFGAEMRAKAIGYAMNMITGAIIALLLGIIGPTILTALSGSTVPSDCASI